MRGVEPMDPSSAVGHGEMPENGEAPRSSSSCVRVGRRVSLAERTRMRKDGVALAFAFGYLGGGWAAFMVRSWLAFVLVAGGLWVCLGAGLVVDEGRRSRPWPVREDFFKGVVACL